MGLNLRVFEEFSVLGGVISPPALQKEPQINVGAAINGNKSEIK